MPSQSMQGTTYLNNLVVAGNISVNDFKYIQSWTGMIKPDPLIGKYPGDPNPATSIPDVFMQGQMRQRPYKTQMILEFRVTDENKLDFDAAPAIVTLNTLPALGAGLVHVIAAKAKLQNPTGTIVTAAGMIAGDIDFQQDQSVLIVMEANGTTPANYDVQIYYELDQATLTQLDPTQYGWLAEDVTAADITTNFNIFLGAEISSIPQLLDASQYYRLMSTSSL